MKTWSRILLIVLCLALLIASSGMHFGTTLSIHGHNSRYAIKWPELLRLRQIAFFGVLAWGVIFAKRDPTFVRVGLITMILSLAITLLPLRLS